jgi:hypothetical protein
MQSEPVQNAPTQPSQVHISKISDTSQKIMPESFANAVAHSKEKNNQNIFDMQGTQMPVLDSIEDILSSMGDTSMQKKKKEESARPVFEEYKGPTAAPTKPVETEEKKPAEPERPLTKKELKAKKKMDKINQQFKKDLAKRGF